MKSSKFLLFGLIFWISFLLTGCDTETNLDSDLPDNEVVSVMKSFLKEINSEDTIIKKEDFDWLNTAEFNYLSNSDDWYYNISWYSLRVNGVKKLPNVNKVFDWWVVRYVWDEIWWSAIDFSKDNMVCSYYLNLEQEIPSELMTYEWDYEDEDYEAYNKAWEDFYDIASYALELYCWYLPDWVVDYKDFNFYWEWMEPFWYASFRWESVYLFTPDWVEDHYIQSIKHQWDNYTISWYSINWKIEKTDCLDWWKWDIHDYTISFDITNESNSVDGDDITHYEWCADKIDPLFAIWEEGTLDTFIKKTNYKYSGNYSNENVFYSITDIASKYMYVNFYQYNWNDYDNYQLLMEETDDWWDVLYEWNWYGISPEKCEELNQYDNNLMDLFFLIVCPRW